MGKEGLGGWLRLGELPDSNASWTLNEGEREGGKALGRSILDCRVILRRI